MEVKENTYGVQMKYPEENLEPFLLKKKKKKVKLCKKNEIRIRFKKLEKENKISLKFLYQRD